MKRLFYMTAEDFAGRTQALAIKMGRNIYDLSPILGIARSTLAAYRSGKRAASPKVITSLQNAERSVGIVVPRKYIQTGADKAPSVKAPPEVWLLQGYNPRPAHYRLESPAAFLALAACLADKSKHAHHLGLTSLDTLIELHAILEQAGAPDALRRVKKIRIHNP